MNPLQIDYSVLNDDACWADPYDCIDRKRPVTG
jgi:hypothetical protein